MAGDVQDASQPEQDWLPPAGEPTAGTSRTSWGSLRLAWRTMAAIVVADQITKWLVVEYVPIYSSVAVIPNLVDFVHVRNTGIAFGFLNDLNHAWQSGITTGLAVVALAGILLYAKQLTAEERWTRLGLSFILGGAVGNLIDRARLGFVVDFVDVYWHDWHFWAFNVADSAITIGAIFILIDLVVPQRHVSNPV
jgi:signal peptidase II